MNKGQENSMTWSTGIVALRTVAVMTTAAAVTPLPDTEQKYIENFSKHAFEQYKQKAEWDSSSLEFDFKHKKKDETIDIGNIVNKTKVILGLPDKDIAEIFHVSRQTIHTYRTQEASLINFKDDTRQRAYEIFDVINKIGKIFEKSPGPGAKNIQINQISLFDLLRKDDLNFEKIVSTATLLEDKIRKDRVSSEVKRDSDLERKRTLYSLTKHT